MHVKVKANRESKVVHSDKNNYLTKLLQWLLATCERLLEIMGHVLPPLGTCDSLELF